MMVVGNKTRKADNPCAFSLAELMVAIGILGIGMLIIAAAFPVALDQTRQAVELQTSQMVFNEAVNKLQTRVDWTRLENEFSSATELGSGSGIYLLNTNNLSTIGLTIPDDCVFSQDNTYGWLAAVQKLTDGMYKFWIFVVREPSGIEDAHNSLKAQFKSPVSVTPSERKLTFNSSPVPNKQQFLLGDDGNIYKVTETTPFGNSVMCDKNTDTVHDVTFITNTTNNKLSRKAPTIWIYETLINY